MLETRGIPLSVNNEEWVYGTPKKFIPGWPLSTVDTWDWWNNFYSNRKKHQGKRAKRRNRWRKRNV